MTKTQKRSPQATAGNADDTYSVQLWFDPDDQPAGTNNCAQVKAMLGDNVIPTQVQLSITKSSAVFANGLSQITQWTDSTGNFTPPVPFTDKLGEPGSMTAQMLTDVNGNPFPNGPSDTEPFTFKAAPNYVLTFTAPAPANNQPAGDNSADEGQVVVTADGPLPHPVVVKFEFTKGSAKFVLTGDPNIQSQSDDRTLYVMTHNENGKDIANASFRGTNISGDTVTLKASLRDFPGVPAQTQDFTFTAASGYGLQLLKVWDGAPADGGQHSQNWCQAVVTYKGGPLPEPLTVQFNVNGKARFGGQQTIQLTTKKDTEDHKDNQDVADAYFTDNTAETVKLTASLPDYPDVKSDPPQLYFEFRPSH